MFERLNMHIWKEKNMGTRAKPVPFFSFKIREMHSVSKGGVS